ncbi:hypothetical protein MKJ04_01245 [Pontibacter sp. E15-1]|uniref:hypothetical protein n=1 Tax=Pontibacter sp. E15-1 TaxID=2919918 RepID=UPI001F4F95B8|nr:hypothetical protein [Pontibacter sp. E15-1]MCJ8163446.1 hypothetical protein [Pontibacter sp. E15-1]
MEVTKEKENKETKDPKNLLEWGVFTVGLVLVLAIFAYLGYETYTHAPMSPELSVEYWPAPTKAQPYRYHVLVRNTGGETAESVTLELVMQQGSTVIERSELQIMYVPQESEREGWINFSRKPATANAVSARIMSYQKP